jgi:uncharacterized protein DUF3775
MTSVRKGGMGGKTGKTLRLTPPDPVAIALPMETACFLVVKAREYDAQVASVDPASGSNPSDDREIDVLEARVDNPTYAEIKGSLDALNEDELIDLVALMWIGRGDYTGEQWAEARAHASRQHQLESGASYLLGTPLLGDYLEEGLAAMGHDCSEFEVGRL